MTIRSDLRRRAEQKFCRATKGTVPGTDEFQDAVWGAYKALTVREASAVWARLNEPQRRDAEMQSSLADHDGSTPGMLRREAVAWHFAMNPPSCARR
jgi:hypothetical protein